jgi:ribulose-5-phosphate 4-epimerase/fuculose-1-phosphate aldolase/putative sterol carrier protein
MNEQEKKLKGEIIDIGKRLYELRLVAGSAGNLSAKSAGNKIFITATGAELRNLNYDNILEIGLDKPGNQRITTEFPLHKAIHESFSNRVIIHCHPVLSNAYFAVYSDIKVLTFETKLYLGNIPVVKQETPAVTRPDLVAQALKTNNLVVLKNHGVVAVAESFNQAFNLIETLEEAVKIAAVARLFKKDILDDLDKSLKEELVCGKTYEMFSKEHIQEIVNLVNKDEFIQAKGQELDLTLEYAIKLDGTDKVYKFNFEKGKITKLEFNDNAPFVASASPQVWELVFLGKLDPFVAVTQSKMKLQGQLGQLAKWYVPFSRLFQIFKEVKIK